MSGQDLSGEALAGASCRLGMKPQVVAGGDSRGTSSPQVMCENHSAAQQDVVEP